MGCQIFSCFLSIFKALHSLHIFATFSKPYVCLFKALCLLFLSNFPGLKFIPCPTYIPNSRVTCVKQPEEISDIFYGWPLSKFHFALHNIRCSNSMHVSKTKFALRILGVPTLRGFWDLKKTAKILHLCVHPKTVAIRSAVVKTA